MQELEAQMEENRRRKVEYNVLCRHGALAKTSKCVSVSQELEKQAELQEEQRAQKEAEEYNYFARRGKIEAVSGAGGE